MFEGTYGLLNLVVAVPITYRLSINTSFRSRGGALAQRKTPDPKVVGLNPVRDNFSGDLHIRPPCTSTDKEHRKQ